MSQNSFKVSFLYQTLKGNICLTLCPKRCRISWDVQRCNLQIEWSNVVYHVEPDEIHSP